MLGSRYFDLLRDLNLSLPIVADGPSETIYAEGLKAQCNVFFRFIGVVEDILEESLNSTISFGTHALSLGWSSMVRPFPTLTLGSANALADGAAHRKVKGRRATRYILSVKANREQSRPSLPSAPPRILVKTGLVLLAKQNTLIPVGTGHIHCGMISQNNMATKAHKKTRSGFRSLSERECRRFSMNGYKPTQKQKPRSAKSIRDEINCC